MNEGKTVCIFGFQPMVIEGLVRALGTEWTILETRLGTKDAAEIVTKHDSDIVILESAGLDRCIDAVGRVRAQNTRTKITVLSAAENVEHAVRALEAGAAGYVSTMSTGQEIAAAINAIHNGATFISPHLAAKVITGFKTLAQKRSKAVQERLNMREEQIARYLLMGKTNKEIAESLGLAEKTVKHYLTVMMQKFSARNRLQLALALPEAPANGFRQRVN